VLVTASAPVAGAEKTLNAFETLTLAPIDRRLVARALLTAEEILWLDGYHARVAETLGPLVDDKTRGWLAEATRPLG
jgi:Xaa-Pro aminopeptidase